MNLQGKKILFIGIGFYDYEKLIVQKLEEKGASVNYINSCRNNILVRILKWIKLHKCAKQQQRINDLLNTTQNCDLVFVIKGQNLNQNDINLIRKNNPNAKFILYLWDSLVRHDNVELLLTNFDNIWSFDRKDCNQNPSLKFRPLFYRILPDKHEKIYELSFVGWMHSDRLEILREAKKQLQQNDRPYFLKLYISPIRYLWIRFIKGEVTAHDKDLIITKPISYNEFQRITAMSRMVLDIAHPKQSGLTMRTVEAIAAGCHLFTSNEDIENYPEIDSRTYTIFDRNNIKIPISKNITTATINDYFSLDTFLSEIFS